MLGGGGDEPLEWTQSSSAGELVPLLLAGQWDGVGLIVSGESLDVKGFSESSYGAFILYAAVGGVIIFAVCLARRRGGRSGKDGCGGSD